MNAVVPIRALALALVLWMFVGAPPALAQDDLDSLMQTDREIDESERHTTAGDEDEEGEEDAPLQDGEDIEAPPEDWQGATPEKEVQEDDLEEAGDDNATPLSVALLAGYGVSLETANPWGAGFGLRAGYNVGQFFVGGRFVYYVGETITVTRPSFSGGSSTEDISQNIWELGGEVGYDIVAGSLVIRPGLGLGLAGVSAGSNSEIYAQVAPGLSLLYGVSDTMFLGIDARFQAILSELGANGIPILATVGMAF